MWEPGSSSASATRLEELECDHMTAVRAPRNISAVCIYTLADIEQVFQNSPFKDSAASRPREVCQTGTAGSAGPVPSDLEQPVRLGWGWLLQPLWALTFNPSLSHWCPVCPREHQSVLCSPEEH